MSSSFKVPEAAGKLAFIVLLLRLTVYCSTFEPLVSLTLKAALLDFVELKVQPVAVIVYLVVPLSL